MVEESESNQIIYRPSNGIRQKRKKKIGSRSRVCSARIPRPHNTQRASPTLQSQSYNTTSRLATQCLSRDRPSWKLHYCERFDHSSSSSSNVEGLVFRISLLMSSVQSLNCSRGSNALIRSTVTRSDKLALLSRRGDPGCVGMLDDCP